MVRPNANNVLHHSVESSGSEREPSLTFPVRKDHRRLFCSLNSSIWYKQPPESSLTATNKRRLAFYSSIINPKFFESYNGLWQKTGFIQNLVFFYKQIKLADKVTGISLMGGLIDSWVWGYSPTYRKVNTIYS